MKHVINRLTRSLLAVATLAAAALSGCTTVIGPQPGQYPPAPPPQPLAPAAVNGAIYQQASAQSLFVDVKARRIGDTITILLNERTQASKSASTDASKNSDFDSGSPVLFGDTRRVGGDRIGETSWETEQDFAGEGSSSQSNRLDGSITVTVFDVLPNGNLAVRGEKWLTLNQGEEYVQVTGIVRQTDVSTENTVPSFKVADARITYSGKGTLADANKPGIVAKIFMRFFPL